jgi:membrane protein implicated in regulation of membrane protease activity
MSLETKRVETLPESETQAIDAYRSFGWALKNRNEIFDSHQHFDGAYSFTFNGVTFGGVQSHNETTHFLSLLFERDTAMPNYSKLQEKEKLYFDTLASLASFENQKRAWHQSRTDTLESYQKYLTCKKPFKPLFWVALGFLSVAVIFLIAALVYQGSHSAYFNTVCTLLWVFFYVPLAVAIVLGVAGLVFFALQKGKADIEKEIASCQKDLAGYEEQRAGYLNALAEALKEGNGLLAPSPEATSPQVPETSSIQDRLSKLKELFDADLISEGDYQSKKEDILRQL